MRLILFVSIIGFCGSISIHAQTFSALNSTGLPAIGNAQAEWFDANNDGYQDLLINGIDNASSKQFELYLNNQDETFTAAGLPVLPLKNASFLLADFNSDNKVDIFYTGRDDSNVPKSYMLINQGTSFTVINNPITPHYRAKLLAYDFDLDGDMDIICSGYNEAGSIETAVWRQSALTFTKQANSLPQVTGGVLAQADFNQDGLLDLFISGENAANNYSTKIFTIDTTAQLTEKVYSAINNYLVLDIVALDYTSDGLTDMVLLGRDASFNPIFKFYKSQSDTYTTLNTGIAAISNGAVDMADMDNDGDRDLVFTGLDASNNYTAKYYQNDGTGSFTDSGITMDAVSNGSLQLVDIIDDDSQDIYLTGFSDTDPFDAIISYVNKSSLVSTFNLPTVPTNLQSTVDKNSVTLSWAEATDIESPNTSLQYKVSLGTSTGSDDVISALITDATELTLMNQQIGSTAESFYLKDLSEGTYFWSVAAIDVTKLSSGFAAEQSFIICDKPDLGPDQEICMGDELALSAGVVADEVNWYSKTDGLLIADNNNFSFTIAANDTIIVEVIKPLGCTVYDTVNIKVLELPSSGITLAQELCIDEVLTLSVATNFTTIDWYRKGEAGPIQAGGQTFDLLIQANDTIVVSMTNTAGCISNDTITVKALELPSQLASVATAICYGETLNYTTPIIYDNTLWRSSKLGLLASGQESLSYQFFESDTLLIDKTNSLGCTETDSLFVTVNPKPIVDLGSDVTACIGDTVQWSLAQNFANIQWSSLKQGVLATDVQSLEFVVAEDDEIYVAITDANGCSNADTVQLLALALPVFNLGADTSLCVNNEILLTSANGFAAVQWRSTQLGALEDSDWFYNYQVLQTDTIIATAFAFNGCTYTDSIRVEAIPLPSYTLGADITTCFGEEVQITVPALADSINWYINEALQSVHTSALSIEATTNATIVAEFISSQNCISTDTLQLLVNPLPIVDLGEDFTICIGDQASLTVATDFSTMSWNSAAGVLATDQASLDVSPAASTTYWVELTDVNGCFTSDTITVAVATLPSFSLGEARGICAGNSTILEVDQIFDAISWYNNLGDTLDTNSGLIDITPENDVWWYATQFTEAGCMATDSVFVSVNPLPVFDAGDEIVKCFDNQVNLAPTALNDAWTLSWAPASDVSDPSIANPLISPATDTWYYLTATTAAGCAFTDSVLVRLDNPVIVDAGNDQTICFGESVQLGGQPTASGSVFDYSYSWSPAAGLSNTAVANPMASPEVTTTYQLIVQAGNCQADTAEVRVQVQSAIESSITADTTIGAGADLQLLATGGVFYSWEPRTALTDSRIPNPIASPLSTTTYRVSITDSLGCSKEESVTIFVRNQVFIPNLFTPNNDGENDYFRLYGTGFESITLQVRNRQGVVVYATSDARTAVEEGWDGTFNGRPAEEGIYVWSLSGQFFDGTAVSFEGENSGIINLIR